MLRSHFGLICLIIVGISSCSMKLPFTEGKDISYVEENTLLCTPGCTIDEDIPHWCSEWITNSNEICTRSIEGGVVCRSEAPRNRAPTSKNVCTKVDLPLLRSEESRASWETLQEQFTVTGRDGVLTYPAVLGIKCNCEISFAKYGYQRGKNRNSSKPNWCYRAYNGCYFVGGVTVGLCGKPGNRAYCTQIATSRKNQSSGLSELE